MKLTVTKTETQEVEIEFPVFKKCDNNTYYKGISENEWIQLMPNISGIMIVQTPYQLGKVLTYGSDIPEDEFNAAFEQVLEHIENYKPQYA